MRLLTEIFAAIGLVVVLGWAFVVMHLFAPLPIRADITVCEQGKCTAYNIRERQTGERR